MKKTLTEKTLSETLSRQYCSILDKEVKEAVKLHKKAKKKYLLSKAGSFPGGIDSLKGKQTPLRASNSLKSKDRGYSGQADY